MVAVAIASFVGGSFVKEFALVLQTWSWNVQTIRSDHSVQERNIIIDAFNDLESDVDILLLSMDLSAYGLNLHKVCCKGIILRWPWNANHLLQILGRLLRIGQTRFVEWVIFYMAGTYQNQIPKEYRIRGVHNY
ncbi:P-loop containing nucleoside triphosphate hydrolase protein [Xylaria curta]|nr:P-loop containing nucleoside triphosphate hydrolase protein [Xylaria curta]